MVSCECLACSAFNSCLKRETIDRKICLLQYEFQFHTSLSPGSWNIELRNAIKSTKRWTHIKNWTTFIDQKSVYTNLRSPCRISSTILDASTAAFRYSSIRWQPSPETKSSYFFFTASANLPWAFISSSRHLSSSECFSRSFTSDMSSCHLSNEWISIMKDTFATIAIFEIRQWHRSGSSLKFLEFFRGWSSLNFNGGLRATKVTLCAFRDIQKDYHPRI